jgi:hypothetical protein
MWCVRNGSNYRISELGEVQKLKITRDDKRAEPIEVFDREHISRLEVRLRVSILLEPLGIIRPCIGLRCLGVCGGAPEKNSNYQGETTGPAEGVRSTTFATACRAFHSSGLLMKRMT